MRIESLLILIVVVEAVWIISSLFRGKEEEKRRAQRRHVPRDPTPPAERPRQPAAPTNVDRYMEEVNRRRRQEAKKEATASRAKPPAPVRRQPAPATTRPLAERIGIPTAAAIEPTDHISAVFVESLPMAKVNSPGEKAPTFRLTETLEMKGSMAASGTTDVGTAGQVHNIPSDTANLPVAAVREHVAQLLRKRDLLRGAILLQEVLGPPLSIRRG